MMDHSHILIIGGSDAGISAALRAKKVNPELLITVLVKDAYPNFSICGIPFFISGEVCHWRNLAHRTFEELQTTGIHFLLNHEALEIDAGAKQVRVKADNQKEIHLSYDRLVIATWAASVKPPIKGMDFDGIFFLRFMEDAFRLNDFIQTKQPKSVLIVGSGYIGMEMADAFHRLGLEVIVTDLASSVIPSLDDEFGDMIINRLTSKRIHDFLSTGIDRIETEENAFTAYSGPQVIGQADMVLIASGAAPHIRLAESAGITLGYKNAISVNRKMETNLADVYTAGDCVETFHRIFQKNTYMPLGTTAHKQGRIVGENAAGGNALFQGVVGTQNVKIFDLVATRTGLNNLDASENGFSPLTTDLDMPDHKAYYPGSQPLRIRVTGDIPTGKLLGAQIIGTFGTEVSKRIDIFAAELYSGLKVAELPHMDLSYTPPFLALGSHTGRSIELAK